MSRSGAVAALSIFTSEQWGMVTAAQARSAGVSRVDLVRLVGDRVLEPVAEAARVYRLVGAPPDPDRESVRAAWLPVPDLSAWTPESLRGKDNVARAIVAGRRLT